MDRCELCDEEEINSWEEYRICSQCIDALLDETDNIIALLRKVAKKHFIYGDTAASGRRAAELEAEVKEMLTRLEKTWGYEKGAKWSRRK